MPQNSVANIIGASSIKFGTSGARGLVSDFSSDVSAAFAIAFVEALKTQNINVERIALGIDRRPSSPDLAASIAGGLQAIGCHVDYYGILPTPALALQSLSEKIPAIMVTGSHIPFDRNGIKFYRPTGEITKLDESLIVSQQALLPAFNPFLPSESDVAQTTYIQRYVAPFPKSALQGLRVGVYEHSSAGREISKSILNALGADVVSLGKTDVFVPIDTEAVSEEDQLQAKIWAKEHNLDAIFSTDGDGDRPLISDEHGNWLKGDVVGMLCAKYIAADALSVPVSCNSAIETYTQIPVTRTKIGSPYVIEAMAKQVSSFKVVAGFEANGGFLCASPFTLNGVPFRELPTRDAVLPLIALLNCTQEKGGTLSQLVDKLPPRFTASDRIQNLPSDLSASLIEVWSFNLETFLETFHLQQSVLNVCTRDGLRVSLDNGQIVHLRPSGNAPELRCYCESHTQYDADSLLSSMLQKLLTCFNSSN